MHLDSNISQIFTLKKEQNERKSVFRGERAVMLPCPARVMLMPLFKQQRNLHSGGIFSRFKHEDSAVLRAGVADIRRSMEAE